jgi:DNA recombination-dependent growth factor C
MFKHLIFYRLPADWAISASDFESQLAGHTLRPCGPFEMSSRGWVAVTHGGRLLHTVNRQHMIALGVDEKLRSPHAAMTSWLLRGAAPQNHRPGARWPRPDHAASPRPRPLGE